MSDTVSENKYMAVDAKTLAYHCIELTAMKNQSIGDKAKFLRSIGHVKKEAGAILNTTENSIRVLVSLNKKTNKKLNINIH